MENILELAVLAIVQGITEFLPISSTAHLILARQVLDLELGAARGTVIDIALHLGSLFAVLIYFWRDVRDAIIGPFTLIGDVVAGRPLRWSSRLGLLLIIATIPLIIFALILSALDLVEPLRDDKDLLIIKVIGWTTLIFGVGLYIADKIGESEHEAKDWGWAGALWMGLAQAFSLIPGTSRSGVTMMASRFLGFDRREGARIALLMSVPAILAANVYTILKMLKANLSDPSELDADDSGLSLAGLDHAGADDRLAYRRGSGLHRRVYRTDPADALAANGDLHAIRRLSRCSWSAAARPRLWRLLRRRERCDGADSRLHRRGSIEKRPPLRASSETWEPVFGTRFKCLDFQRSRRWIG